MLLRLDENDSTPSSTTEACGRYGVYLPKVRMYSLAVDVPSDFKVDPKASLFVGSSH